METGGPMWPGISYLHVNALGSELLFPEDSEVGQTHIYDSLDDGMLFAIGAQGGDNVVSAGVATDGSGWDVRVQDNAANLTDGGEDEVRL